MDAAIRRDLRAERASIIHAYRTANLQGAEHETLQQLLDAVVADPARRQQASTEQLMTTMARWRAVMADPNTIQAPNPQPRRS